jgi:hypothetical protein
MAAVPRALRGVREALDRLDADHRGDARRLELPPGVAEECLHGGGVEPAADLIRAGDGEVLACGGEKTAAFELFLQGLAFGFCALEHGVSLADCIGESFVREIVKARCGR